MKITAYGSLGNAKCLLYNLNVACSTTSQGRESIALATILFESFLSNSVKFGSLNEIISYFDNIIGEERKFDSKDFIDEDVSVEDCFAHIILTCGFNWIPSEKEMDIIWTMLNRFSQEDINRIYYKNNLYEFMENKSMVKSIKLLLKSLDEPFMDPNNPPESIKPLLDGFLEVLMEFVYYHHQIIDRIDRCDNMIKNVCCISDTDSAIVSLDAWYRYTLDKVHDEDMKIKKVYTDVISWLDRDEDGNYEKHKVVEFVEDDYDYDFFNDEVINIKRSIQPCKIIPEDGLKYSIVNIMAYVLTKLSDDLLLRYSKINNSYQPGKPCLMSLKNEFLFSRSLLTDNKKNYATKQILQEGNLIPEEESLDIKGLSINKPPLSKEMRSELKKIVYEDILNTPFIDQVQVLKKLAILEKKIYTSLQNGEKTFYKSSTIKSLNVYDDPLRIQGVKASMVWNSIKDDNAEAIDLSARNAVDIVKVDINSTNVEIIRDDYPETYDKIINLLQDPIYKGNVTAIAIPKDCSVPRWLSFFIDYTSIINDNIGTFPLESIGVSKVNNKKVNYSNIVQI